MILPDFIIESKINLTADYQKPDSPDDCLNIDWFNSYKFPITYNFNSRGYRDQEWPNANLQDCIWCVGDSFTVGVGSPLEHTWPYILHEITGKPIINVSVSGASNTWISRKAERIITEINPTNIVIMWSFFSRREHSDTTLTDEERQVREPNTNAWQSNYKNFAQNRNKIKNYNVHFIDCCIPRCSPNMKQFLGIDLLRTLIKDETFLGEVPILDLARDYYHFDIKTSKYVVEKIVPLLK